MHVCHEGEKDREEGESGKGDEASVRNLGGASETWLIWGWWDGWMDGWVVLEYCKVR